jgi:hypothetical protein
MLATQTRFQSGLTPSHIMIYQKTLKGAEEIALRTGGVSLRLRPYLLIVDGKQTVAELAAENPGMPEMDMILRSLAAEGFISIKPADAIAAEARAMSAQVSNGGSMNVVQMPMAAPSAPPASPRNNAFEYRKSQIVADLSRVLGRDAPPVIAKVQNCPSDTELFALLMGIKKIISMYANAAEAEAFMDRHSGR